MPLFRNYCTGIGLDKEVPLMNNTNLEEINVNLPGRTAIPNQFAVIARFLGIISLLCIFMNILFFALIFGGLAIILAVLSKGSSAFMSNPAVAGMITGSISITMVIFMLAVSIYSVLFIPEYRQQFNTWYKETYEQLYGQPDDEGLDPIFYNTDIPRVGGGDL